MIIKKEQLLFYTPLCIALLLHLILVLCLFFIKEHFDTTPLFSESAPVIFDERGEAGTALGSPDGTEVAKEVSQAATAAAVPDITPDITSEEPEIESSEESAPEPEIAPVTEIPDQLLPALLEPATMPRELPRAQPQPDIPVQYAPPALRDEQPKPRRRAAWHKVGTTARTQAASLNINKHVRTFTDQQYDAYGSPNGTGGSSDHGTGTGGGGNAAYHANINSLDLIKQSYMRKLVRAIVAQSNYMKLMVATPYPISKHVTWKIVIGPNAKVQSIEKEEETHPSLDTAISKIIYATQLPPLPSRFKEEFIFYARFQLNHSGDMAPLILMAVLD